MRQRRGVSLRTCVTENKQRWWKPCSCLKLHGPTRGKGNKYDRWCPNGGNAISHQWCCFSCNGSKAEHEAMAHVIYEEQVEEEEHQWEIENDHFVDMSGYFYVCDYCEAEYKDPNTHKSCAHGYVRRTAAKLAGHVHGGMRTALFLPSLRGMATFRFVAATLAEMRRSNQVRKIRGAVAASLLTKRDSNPYSIVDLAPERLYFSARDPTTGKGEPYSSGTRNCAFYTGPRSPLIGRKILARLRCTEVAPATAPLGFAKIRGEYVHCSDCAFKRALDRRTCAPRPRRRRAGRGSFARHSLESWGTGSALENFDGAQWWYDEPEEDLESLLADAIASALPLKNFDPSTATAQNLKIGGVKDCWRAFFTPDQLESSCAAIIPESDIMVDAKRLVKMLESVGSVKTVRAARFSYNGNLHIEEVQIRPKLWRFDKKYPVGPDWVTETELSKWVRSDPSKLAAFYSGLSAVATAAAEKKIADIKTLIGARDASRSAQVEATMTFVAPEMGGPIVKDVMLRYLEHVKRVMPGLPTDPLPPDLGPVRPWYPSTPGELPPLGVFPCPKPVSPDANLEDMPLILPSPDDYGTPPDPTVGIPLPEPNLEHMPRWVSDETWWHKLVRRCLSRASDALYNFYVHHLAGLDLCTQAFYLSLGDVLKFLLATAKTKLSDVLSMAGLHLLMPLTDTATVLLGALVRQAMKLVPFVGDVAIGITTLAGEALSVVHAATIFFRVIAILVRDNTEYHGPDHVYRATRHFGYAGVQRPHIYPPTQEEAMFPMRPIDVPILIQNLPDPRHSLPDGRQFGPIQDAITRSHASAVQTIGALPRRVLPLDTPREILEEIQVAFPHVAVVGGINSQPHPIQAMVRRNFREIVAESAKNLGGPLALIGGSNQEAMTIPGVVHNCAPILSGRDYARHYLRAGGDAQYRAHCCPYRVEECPADKIGMQYFASFSAHDIPPGEFVKMMVRTNVNRAFLAMNLPIPLIDRRVKQYHDPTTQLRYEVNGSKLEVYHHGEHSAGYCHDFESVLAWMGNMPTFDGLHVQMESIAQLGTMFLLQLDVTPGRQETIPTMWSLHRERFYILPEIIGGALSRDPNKHFAVPARRFEQLTAFVANLAPTEREAMKAGAKLRGLMAEVRVGKHTIDKRWYVSLPQFYSLVAHCLIADKIYSTAVAGNMHSVMKYYDRVAWRNGGLLKRCGQRYLDALFFRTNGERHPFEMVARDRAPRHVANPYVEAGEYRLVNTEVQGSKWMVINEAQLARFYIAMGCKEMWSKFKRVKLAFGAQRDGRPGDSPDVTPPLSEAEAVFRNAQNTALPSTDGDWDSAPSSEGSTRPSTPESSTSIEYTDAEPDVTPAVVMGVRSVVQLDPLDTFFESPEMRPTVAVKPESVDDCRSVASEVASAKTAAPEGVVAGDVEAEPMFGEITNWLETVDVGPEAFAQGCEGENRDAELRDLVEDRTVYGLPEKLCSPAATVDVNFIAAYAPTGNPLDTHWGGSAPLVGSIETMAHHGAVIQLDNKFERIPKRRYHSIPNIFKMLGLETSNEVRSRMLGLFGSFTGTAADAPLNNKLHNFVASAIADKAERSINVIHINGPAMSAKSSLAREYAVMRADRVLVYVPSRKLKEDWEGAQTKSAISFSARAKVYTRMTPISERAPSARARVQSLGIIDEVYNFSETELLLHLRELAKAGCQRILLVGDQYQREAGGVDQRSELLREQLQLRVSFGMPRDAHALFRKINRLDDSYVTTGTRKRSVYFTSRELRSPADMSFKMHSTSAPAAVELTVGKVQGSRARRAHLFIETGGNKAGWLTHNDSRRSVAITRHTQQLIISGNQVIWENLTGENLVALEFVDGRNDYEKPFARSGLDVLIGNHTFETVRKLGSSIMARVPSITFTGEAINATSRRSAAGKGKAFELVTPPKLHVDVEAVCIARDNFTPPDGVDVGIVVDNNGGAITFQVPDPPELYHNVRSNLQGAASQAAIFHSGSGAHTFRSLVERQVGPCAPRRGHYTHGDFIDGIKMYKRNIECYYADKTTIYPGCQFADYWLASRDPANANNISTSDPLFETARTLMAEVSDKKQSKFKPGEDFTTLYNQTILANSKVMNARFANEQPKLYFNLPKLLRDDVVLDYGLTDDELSAKLRALGLAAEMNGPNNIQIDLSKQDSTHSPATIIAFYLTALDCGLDEETMWFYLKYCEEYQFASRTSDYTRGRLHFNLGSGDPFTLIRNDWMEATIVACTYEDVPRASIVLKGDDLHAVMYKTTKHPLSSLNGVQITNMKVDYGAVGYHAGRFHNGYRYLADPIRVFAKHVTRLEDENVSVEALYLALMDRATDWVDAEVEFLYKAAQMVYTFYSADEIVAIVDYVRKLRDWEFFRKSYEKPREQVVIDTRDQCLSNCVRALKPGRSRNYYRAFNDLPVEDAKLLLAARSIPFIDVNESPHVMARVPHNVVLLSGSHARVILW